MISDEEKTHIIKVLRADLDNNISSVEARRDASPVMDKIEFLKKIGTPDDLIERTKEWQMKNGLDPEGLYNKAKAKAIKLTPEQLDGEQTVRHLPIPMRTTE